MNPMLAWIAGGLLTVMLSAAQGTPITPSTPKRGGNPEGARIKNPVTPTPDSVAAGRRVYARLCVRCHGPEGKGDGGGAGAGGQPADLTDSMWDFGASDGEIFTVLRDGTSADMESYAERMTETEMWNVVNYLRSLRQP
jgi:mono/diheme cytochrome c family protein